MNYKKMMSIGLSAALSLSLLTACGGNNSAGNGSTRNCCTGNRDSGNYRGDDSTGNGDA